MAKSTLEQTIAKSIDIKEMLLAGATKPLVERAIAMTPVGNGNLASGLTKLTLALGTKKYAPDFLTIALAVDGAEDIMGNVLNLVFGYFGGASAGADTGLSMNVM